MDSNQRPVVPPSSGDVLGGAMRQAMRAINCVQIGTIEAFDPETQLANISIAMKQVKDVFENGTRTLQEYPLLMECPVVTLFGGVDFLSMPVTKGDNCIVLFNDREIDNWLNSGDGQAPTTFRMHDISDAFAIVGIRPLTNSIVGFLANGIRLSHGGGSSQLDLTEGLIQTVANLFLHNGSLQVLGNAVIEGTLTANVVNAGNGASGSFNVVQVQNGIVVGGS